LEYFRSELYYLRFSWLNAGYAFSEQVQTVPFRFIGVYGFGFVLMLAACALNFLPVGLVAADVRRRTEQETPDSASSRRRLPGFVCLLLVLVGLGLWMNLPAGSKSADHTGGLTVAGVQMEFPGDPQIIVALNTLKKQHPEAAL